MMRIFAADGSIPFVKLDVSAVLEAAQAYIPGAHAYVADDNAGKFVYYTYSHPLYTLYRSSYMPVRDMELKVELQQPFIGFRLMLQKHLLHHVNNKSYYLMQGQSNIVYAPQIFSVLELKRGEAYEVFDMQLQPVFLNSLPLADKAWKEFTAGVNGDKTIAYGNGPGFLHYTAYETLAALLKEPGNEVLAAQLMEEVITGRMVNVKKRLLTEHQIENLFKVKNHIRQHFAEDMHLKQWARMAEMNITYFKEYFRVAFGISPYHYLLYERITAAKKMLLFYPQLSFSEVAMACGFSNNNNLRRAFLAVEKKTLKQWRNLSDRAGLLLILDFIAQQ